MIINRLWVHNIQTLNKMFTRNGLQIARNTILHVVSSVRSHLKSRSVNILFAIQKSFSFVLFCFFNSVVCVYAFQLTVRTPLLVCKWPTGHENQTFSRWMSHPSSTLAAADARCNKGAHPLLCPQKKKKKGA